MSAIDRAQRLNELTELLERPGGKQAFRFALNAIGGVVPVAGGLVSAVGSLWAEREQTDFSKKLIDWAALADAEIGQISESVNRLLAQPSIGTLSLLLGEMVGEELSLELLASPGSYIPIILNPITINELAPYITRKWLTLESTGSVCAMGANNRIGGHFEELKRPYGMGNGFNLAVTDLAQSQCHMRQTT
jgi:hypothetical protein